MITQVPFYLLATDDDPYKVNILYNKREFFDWNFLHCIVIVSIYIIHRLGLTTDPHCVI